MQVVADKNGKIYKLESNIYCDTGSSPNEPTSLYGMICSQRYMLSFKAKSATVNFNDIQ